MTMQELKIYFQAAPHRCPACDAEWHEHRGLGPTCMDKERLFRALELALPYCRPPETGGIDANIEYLEVMQNAKAALEDLA